MAENYDVAIRIVSQKGTCEAGHKVGDEWTITVQDFKTPQGMCIYAFDAIFPFSQVLMYGGSFPWETDPDVTTVACPDAENPVVFELKRLRK